MKELSGAGRPVTDVPVGFTGWAVLTTTATSDLWTARDRHGRRCVVKILRHHADPDAKRLFLDGTEVLAGLPRHPYVLEVVDRGTTPAGRPWAAQPLVPGGSLADRTARSGPLTPREGAALLWHAAEALAFTAAHGVLHRDVKPSNILLGVDDAPLLTDFQTATRLRDGRGSVTTAALTEEYAAVEVLLHGRYTAQSEVFSLCATLANALGAPSPHSLRPGETFAQFLARVDDGSAARELDLPGVPDPLVHLLRSGLDHDPAERPSGAAGLVDGLRAVHVELEWSLPASPQVAVRARMPMESASHRPERAEGVSGGALERLAPHNASERESVSTTQGSPRRLGAVSTAVMGSVLVALLGVGAALSADSFGWSLSSGAGGSGSADLTRASSTAPTTTAAASTDASTSADADGSPGGPGAPSVSTSDPSEDAGAREPQDATPTGSAATHPPSQEAPTHNSTVTPTPSDPARDDVRPEPAPVAPTTPVTSTPTDRRPPTAASCHRTAIRGSLSLGADEAVTAGGPNFTSSQCDFIAVKLTSATYVTYARACLQGPSGALGRCGQWVYLSYPDTWDTLLTDVAADSTWQLQMYGVESQDVRFSMTR